MKFPQINFPHLKISKTALFITIGIIVLSVFSILSPSNSPVTTPTTTPTSYSNNSTITPNPSLGPSPTPAPLSLISTYPSDTTPTIAGTNTAIIFNFNRNLTSDELNTLTVNIKPELQSHKMIDVNHKTVYITPDSSWQNGQRYAVYVLFSHPTKVFSFTFTPNSQFPPGTGVGGEENLSTP
jgi:hypothetical protein